MNTEQILKERADAVKRTIEAVKQRGMRNAYACTISGEFHETYTIKGSVLDEIEQEMLEECR